GRGALAAGHRAGEADELSLEARVGRHLLIAAHRRGEDRFAEGEPWRADRLPGEHLAVLEDQEPAHDRNATRPAAIVSRTRPRRRRPSSQEFDERERKPDPSTRQPAARSISVRLAGAPTATLGRSRPKMAAGPAENRSSSVSSRSTPGSTSSV